MSPSPFSHLSESVKPLHTSLLSITATANLQLAFVLMSIALTLSNEKPQNRSL